MLVDIRSVDILYLTPTPLCGIGNMRVRHAHFVNPIIDPNKGQLYPNPKTEVYFFYSHLNNTAWTVASTAVTGSGVNADVK